MKKLDLDAPWCIGSEDYATLVKHTSGQKIKQILELGSGQSSLQLAKDFPMANLLSFESDIKFTEKARESLLQNGISNAKIEHVPIKPHLWKGGVFMTYDMSIIKDINPIDLLIVDGPVERLFPLGREASLYLLFDKCAQNCLIGVDDYHRKSGHDSVNNWLYTFGDSLSIVEKTATFAVLRKVSECKEPKIKWRQRINSINSIIYTFITGIRRSASKLKGFKKW